MPIRVRLSNDGFFTNFNTALDWLAFGDEHGVGVGIDWSLDRSQSDWDFSYGEVGKNLWDSFFEPIPAALDADLVVSQPWTPTLGGFRAMRFTTRWTPWRKPAAGCTPAWTAMSACCPM